MDGFDQADAIATAEINSLPSGSPQTANYDFVSIDLTDARFQGLSSITFRIYASDDWTAGTVYDDILVNGTVAPVPEPAALGLLGMGALALLGRRRNA